MAVMVGLWMATVKEQADDMLKKGSRRNRSSSEKLVMKKEKLTERERKSINWVKTNYIEKIPISHEIDGITLSQVSNLNQCSSVISLSKQMFVLESHCSCIEENMSLTTTRGNQAVGEKTFCTLDGIYREN